MAYTETDRVWLRHFLGFSATFIESDPRLESAITATQSIADGGSRPDSSTENWIKALIYGQVAVIGPPIIPQRMGLLQVKANLDNLMSYMGATAVDDGEVKVDAPREDRRIRMQGRAMCQELCRMLGLRGVRADIWASANVIEGNEDPFVAQGSLIGI